MVSQCLTWCCLAQAANFVQRGRKEQYPAASLGCALSLRCNCSGQGLVTPTFLSTSWKHCEWCLVFFFNLPKQKTTNRIVSALFKTAPFVFFFFFAATVSARSSLLGPYKSAAISWSGGRAPERLGDFAAAKRPNSSSWIWHETYETKL